MLAAQRRQPHHHPHHHHLGHGAPVGDDLGYSDFGGGQAVGGGGNPSTSSTGGHDYYYGGGGGGGGVSGGGEGGLYDGDYEDGRDYDEDDICFCDDCMNVRTFTEDLHCPGTWIGQENIIILLLQSWLPSVQLALCQPFAKYKKRQIKNIFLRFFLNNLF